MSHRLHASVIVCALTLGACGGGPQRVSGAPTQSDENAVRPLVQGGEFRVVGNANGSGDAYDATLLFERANAAVRTHRCDAALQDYDRLVAEFPTSHLVPPAQYNRGVCLQAMGRADDAIAAFRECAAHSTARDLTRDAFFRLAVMGELTQRAQLVFDATTAVLAFADLSIPDHIEALARRSAAMLSQHDYSAATRTAQEAIALAPTEESIHALGDDEFAAEARFVLADATRQQATDVHINVESPDLERAIERRVQLVIHAHVQFNETIRAGNPHWEAAAGYSIGQMYRALYDSIVFAQVPADWEAPAVTRYRTDSGRRLRPLLQGVLRAWEATMQMGQQMGIGDNDWVLRAQRDVGELRELVLNGQVPAAAIGGSETGSSAPPTATEASSASPAPTEASSAPPPGASAAASSAPPDDTTVARTAPRRPMRGRGGP